MTWVPPYAASNCLVRLNESHGGVGMKDALTHLGLQFWRPATDGSVALAGRTNDINDAAIREFRDWGHDHGVRVLLCIYNHVKSWDWNLARAAFVEHPATFRAALLSEVDRLQLDGVDIDLEGNGAMDADREAFVSFVRDLSKELHQRGKHLTLDSFAYKWNAPNQSWWADLLPHVDALTTMGYEEIGASAADWRSYAAQQEAAGKRVSRLMLGMPSGKDAWRGSTVLEQLKWVKSKGKAGVSFWDAQLRAPAWREKEVWLLLRDISGRRSPVAKSLKSETRSSEDAAAKD